MTTIQNINNKIQKERFDEQTKSVINSYLEEIDRKQQSYQSRSSEEKQQYIRFTSDKESKILSFTGKVNKREEPATDFDTGLDIPDRLVSRYRFECYDITTIYPQELDGLSAIWERGTRDAQTILNFLSKDFNVLEIVRNGQPYSKTTTYLITPMLG
jgi:hypothetical protein